MRRTTSKLLEMAEDGTISWEQLAHSALISMSEKEVEQMAWTEYDIEIEIPDEEDAVDPHSK